MELYNFDPNSLSQPADVSFSFQGTKNESERLLVGKLTAANGKTYKVTLTGINEDQMKNVEDQRDQIQQLAFSIIATAFQGKEIEEKTLFLDEKENEKELKQQLKGQDETEAYTDAEKPIIKSLVEKYSENIKQLDPLKARLDSSEEVRIYDAMLAIDQIVKRAKSSGDDGAEGNTGVEIQKDDPDGPTRPDRDPPKPPVEENDPPAETLPNGFGFVIEESGEDELEETPPSDGNNTNPADQPDQPTESQDNDKPAPLRDLSLPIIGKDTKEKRDWVSLGYSLATFGTWGLLSYGQGWDKTFQDGFSVLGSLALAYSSDLVHQTYFDRKYQKVGEGGNFFKRTFAKTMPLISRAGFAMGADYLARCGVSYIASRGNTPHPIGAQATTELLEESVNNGTCPSGLTVGGNVGLGNGTCGLNEAPTMQTVSVDSQTVTDSCNSTRLDVCGWNDQNCSDCSTSIFDEEVLNNTSIPVTEDMCSMHDRPSAFEEVNEVEVTETSNPAVIDETPDTQAVESQMNSHESPQTGPENGTASKESSSFFSMETLSNAFSAYSNGARDNYNKRKTII